LTNDCESLRGCETPSCAAISCRTLSRLTYKTTLSLIGRNRSHAGTLSAYQSPRCMWWGRGGSLTVSRSARNDSARRPSLRRPLLARRHPGRQFLCDNPVDDELAEAGAPAGLIDDRAAVAAVRGFLLGGGTDGLHDSLPWRKADSNRRFRDALRPPTALPWCDAA